MAHGNAGKDICPTTGVAIPECCCQRCVEEQIRRFMPRLLRGDVRVTRAPQWGTRDATRRAR